MTKNPLDSIQNRLEAIENFLSKDSFVPNKYDVWERGVEVASEVLGLSNVVVIMNIGEIPHFKLRGVYYFNKKILKDFVTANSYNVSIMGLK